jgi:hypothetical protein
MFVATNIVGVTLSFLLLLQLLLLLLFLMLRRAQAQRVSGPQQPNQCAAHEPKQPSWRCAAQYAHFQTRSSQWLETG